MNTVREIFDHYLPKLIVTMKDPRLAIEFCKQFNPPYTMMGDLTKNIPSNRVHELWTMIVNSSFVKDPNPLIKEMDRKIKELKGQERY